MKTFKIAHIKKRRSFLANCNSVSLISWSFFWLIQSSHAKFSKSVSLIRTLKVIIRSLQSSKAHCHSPQIPEARVHSVLSLSTVLLVWKWQLTDWNVRFWALINRTGVLLKIFICSSWSLCLWQTFMKIHLQKQVIFFHDSIFCLPYQAYPNYLLDKRRWNTPHQPDIL